MDKVESAVFVVGVVPDNVLSSPDDDLPMFMLVLLFTAVLCFASDSARAPVAELPPLPVADGELDVCRAATELLETST